MRINIGMSPMKARVEAFLTNPPLVDKQKTADYIFSYDPGTCLAELDRTEAMWLYGDCMNLSNKATVVFANDWWLEKHDWHWYLWCPRKEAVHATCKSCKLPVPYGEDCVCEFETAGMSSDA